MSQEKIQKQVLKQSGNAESFVQDFFFGQNGIVREGRIGRAHLVFDSRTQGWVGLPHGGIGMGAMVELAGTLDACPAERGLRYPMSLEYRLGGSPARIGDVAMAEVSAGDGHISGRITIGEDPSPYLTAAIRYGIQDPEDHEDVLSRLPKDASALLENWVSLPHYKYCFVCGTERKHPGLNRSFYLLGSSLPDKIIVSPIGLDAGDLHTVCRFQEDGLIHPVVFLALLDETVGWGGFMASGSGGVTVRIRFTFYRDIRVGERIVIFGRGDRVRGKAPRLLYWGSGGAVAVQDDGRLEPVIAVSGQYLGVPELTEQMKVELRPEDLTRRAFDMAGM